MDRNLIDKNLATVTRFLNGTHSGDVDVIDDTVTPDIVTHGFPGGSPASREQYKQWFRAFGAAFSNGAFEVLATVADEHMVAVRWRVSADHTGPYAGAAPSRRRVSFTGVALYRMADGLIAETWLHADERGLLTQIGALPTSVAA